MAKQCKRCGSDIVNRMSNATLCWSCARAGVRVSEEGAKRAGDFKRKIIDGKVFCVDCNQEIEFSYKRRGGAPMRCKKCSNERSNAIKSIQQAAHTAVAKAIRHGSIDKPSAFKCSDCGKPAECYDHRDYSKPLDVEPVCLSCNVIRGSADRRKAA